MKNNKRFAASAMALSFALALGACGGNAAPSTESASADASESVASETATSEVAAENAENAEAAQSSDASTTTEADAPDTYTNEFFGILYNLPEGWSFQDTATLEQENNLVAVLSQNATLDMAAMDAEKNQVVLVDIIAPDENTANLTAEQYLEAKQDEVIGSIEGNYTYETSSASVTFSGIDRELPASVMKLNVDGDTAYISQAVAEKDGGILYAAAVGRTEDEVLDAFKNFRALVA
ncbi:MAG: hypothetical protein IKG21_12385 [Atopobiaceae bacterium]|nr:hypothetical protein [Atopobiaceae bacterium]